MSTPTPVPPATPPYVLRTPRLIVRCLEPADAARRKDALDSSGEHLAGYYPQGVAPLEAQIAHVRRMRANFDLDQDRAYGTFEPDSGRMLGEVFLLKRAGIAALEIGYWLRLDAVGKGIATEMASALVKVAFEFDKVRRLDLMCSPENERSAAVARRLGFTLEGRLRDRQIAAHHPRSDLLCFTLLAVEYPRSPASQLPLEAFDFLGQRLG